MDNVIGPIPIDSWYYMRMLRESVKDCTETDRDRYKLMIEEHNRLYREELKQWV